jgi:hypothetical protein
MIPRLSVLFLVLLLGAAPAALAADDKPDVVTSFLQDVTLGEGTATAEIIIFPLIAKEKPTRLEIQPSTWAKNIAFHEPEFPKRRYDVSVANNETAPLLLLGGTILGGGSRDRVVPADVLVPSGARVEIETIVASSRRDQRREPVPFRLGSALAPPYVRERAQFQPSNTLVPNFVSHFLDFRNDGDKRESLSAINASTSLSKLCIPCHESLAAFPTASGGRVVGVVTAVRGRIRSLEAFGDNRLFKAWFEPLLKSQTFAAAAIAVKARRIGLKVPTQDTAENAMEDLRAKAQKLLDQIRKARFRAGDVPRNSMGSVTLLRTSNSTRGTAIALEGRLVHLSVFPYEPFESALFASRVRAPSEGTEYGGTGGSELERRSLEGRRLTEFEKRYLRRIRGR